MDSNPSKVTTLARLCSAELVDTAATFRLRKLLSSEQRAFVLRSMCARLPHGSYRHEMKEQLDPQIQRVTCFPGLPQIFSCAQCSVEFTDGQLHLAKENKGNLEHMARCLAKAGVRIQRKCAWADSLRCNLPTNYFQPTNQSQGAFLTQTRPLPDGWTNHPENPDLVLIHPQIYSKPLPRALLNALAPFWRGVPTTQPKEFVKDT